MFGPPAQKLSRANQHAARSSLGNARERFLDFIFIAGVDNVDLHVKASRRLVHVGDLRLGSRIGLIDQQAHQLGRGYQFMEQPQSL